MDTQQSRRADRRKSGAQHHNRVIFIRRRPQPKSVWWLPRVAPAILWLIATLAGLAANAMVVSRNQILLTTIHQMLK